MKASKRFLKLGSKYSDAGFVNAITFLAESPMQAMGFSVFSMMIADFLRRQLSNKEISRMSTVSTLAFAEIKKRIEEGEKPRDDIWHSEMEPSCEAEDMFENINLKARDEIEQKKLPFYAKIFSDAVFDPDLSINQLNALLNLIDKLSYRQIVYIRIFSDTCAFNLSKTKLKAGQGITYEKLSIYMELFELFKEGLLILNEPDKSTHTIVIDLKQIIPAFVSLSTQGEYLFSVAGIKNLELEELRPFISEIS